MFKQLGLIQDRLISTPQNKWPPKVSMTFLPNNHKWLKLEQIPDEIYIKNMPFVLKWYIAYLTLTQPHQKISIPENLQKRFSIIPKEYWMVIFGFSPISPKDPRLWITNQNSTNKPKFHDYFTKMNNADDLADCFKFSLNIDENVEKPRTDLKIKRKQREKRHNDEATETE